MPTQATATFQIKNWDEKPYQELPDEGKLTRAHVTYTYQGDIEGEGTVEYLMVYPPNSAASFVGLERVVGRIGDRSGSFVIQHTGIADQDGVKGTYFVVPGSGTGDLRGLRGEGNLALAGQAEHYPIAMTYEFEE
jgi:hypothetical protein